MQSNATQNSDNFGKDLATRYGSTIEIVFYEKMILEAEHRNFLTNIQFFIIKTLFISLAH